MGSRLEGWGPTFGDLAAAIRRWAAAKHPRLAEFSAWARRLDRDVYGEGGRWAWVAVLLNAGIVVAYLVLAYAKSH